MALKIPWATLGVFVTCALLLILSKPEILAFRGIYFIQGEWWKAIRTLFLSSLGHMDWVHFGGNMIIFWIVGALVEARLGGLKMLGLFFGTHLAGVATMIRVRSLAITAGIGASGAIFGLIGFALVALPKTIGLRCWLIAAAFYQLITQLELAFSPWASRIAFDVHMGGLLLGIMLGFLYLIRKD